MLSDHDRDKLYRWLGVERDADESWTPEFCELLKASRALGLARLERHGDFERFFEVAKELTSAQGGVNFGIAAPGAAMNENESERAFDALRRLEPWRKGPFSLGNRLIDAEWRSDLKWDRLEAIATPFRGRRVLDVGCGNGYYLFRLEGAGAKLAMGVEPSVLYVSQFLALSKMFAPKNIAMFPGTLEELPKTTAAFNTVLSMGVLYHRRDPQEHLRELRSYLEPSGELIVETLILEGEHEAVLVPAGRYAMMRNVFSLPSPPLLKRWLNEAGFGSVEFSAPVRTTQSEQRSTSLSPGPSLDDFLDPRAPHLTVEGHPAPVRILARAIRL